MRPSSTVTVDTNRSQVDGRLAGVPVQATWMAFASGWPITMERSRYGGAFSRRVTIPASTPGPVATATRTLATETGTRSSGTEEP